MRNRFSGMGGISSGRTVDVTKSSCSFSSELSALDLREEMEFSIKTETSCSIYWFNESEKLPFLFLLLLFFL